MNIMRFVKRNKTTLAVAGAAVAAYWFFTRKKSAHMAGYYVPGMFPENYTGFASYEGGGLVAEYPNAPQMTLDPQLQAIDQPLIEELVIPSEHPWYHRRRGYGSGEWHRGAHHRWR